MADLDAALRVTGRIRRRFLAECRDHLVDLEHHADRGDAAVAFGPPGRVAASFDAAVASTRGVRATWTAAFGAATVGGSTLALIWSADAAAQAAVPWALAFFLSAQVSAVAIVIGLIQAVGTRGHEVSPADSALLCRRNAIALVSALVAMFAAGGALTGNGNPLVLLAGPAVAGASAVVVGRAWWFTRQLAGARARIDRSPFADLRSWSGLHVPTVGPLELAIVMATGAVVRDHGEQGSTLAGSVRSGAIEAAFVLVAFLVLRAPLGLRTSVITAD
ncbi:MAG: hypothetical protein ABIO83_10260 [Ilumatobacteraceae bacterium]